MSKKNKNDEIKNQEETTVATEENAAESSSPENEKVKILEDKIKELENKVSENNDKFLRLMAEYDNYRKRTQKEKDSIYPEAVADTVLKFLPLSDSFERALAFECKDDEFKKGIEMINSSLKDIFSNLKVEQIGEIGEKFNPDFHNAVMHEENEDLDENTIVEVFQKGYKMEDKILRYAMVKVAN